MINKIIFATKNKGKAEQVRDLLKLNNVNGIDVVTEKEIGFFDEVIEDGKSFEENSEKKARVVYEYCKNNNIDLSDIMIVADDSGLCVDKLDGAPGIYSARFAGEGATEEEKRQEILNEMEQYIDDKDRTARFVTVMTGILNDGRKIVTRGECEGRIAKEIGKTPSKLTYNQLLIPNGFDKTISDLSEEEFKRITHHREIALMELIKQVKSIEK